MPLPPPADWTLDDARKAVQLDALERARIAVSRAFYEGDHWQAGTGWIGPMPQRGESGYETARRELERAFTSRNVIAEVIDRHMAGVVGKEPQRGWVPREEPEDGKEVPTAIAGAADEALRWHSEWWDDNDAHAGLQAAVSALLYGGRQAAYLVIPPGALRRNADGVLEIPDGDAGKMMSLLRLRFPAPDQCTVYTDPDTLRQVGVYTYRVDNVERADITYVDPATGRTVLKTVGEGGTVLAAVGWNFGGYLPMFEMRRPAIVTEQVRQGQRALNLALSMIPRNVVTGGFLERVLLNAQLPGTEEVQADGTKRFIPDAIPIGPGTFNNFQGAEQYGADGKFAGYASPSVHWREPVDTAASESAVSAHERAILAEVDQRHVLMADDATASGYSRQHARAEFVASLRRTAAAVDGLLVWLLEASTAMAEAFAGTPQRYTKDLRAAVRCRLDAGPPSPDEMRANRELGDAGYLSPETVLALNGVDDVTAELQRIDAHRIQRGSKEEAELLAAYTGAGLSLYAALLRVGHTEEAARLLIRSDVPDGLDQ